jgi:RNA polymerase sigma factor (sigma-70 family)
MALLRAIRGFEANGKDKFITYAHTCIYNALLNHVLRDVKKPPKKLPSHLVDKRILNISDYLPDGLSLEEKSILQMKYEGYTLEEIGKSQGYNRSHASKALKTLYKKLKQANCV